MNITTHEADPMSLGYFFTFVSTDTDQFCVRTENYANYRIHVTVHLPLSAQDKWFAYLQAVLKRVQLNLYRTVRFDYNNAIRFFSVDQLQSLDTVCKTTSFCLYNAPRYLVEPTQVTKLDTQKIVNSARRKQYSEQKKAAFMQMNAPVKIE